MPFYKLHVYGCPGSKSLYMINNTKLVQCSSRETTRNLRNCKTSSSSSGLNRVLSTKERERIECRKRLLVPSLHDGNLELNEATAYKNTAALSLLSFGSVLAPCLAVQAAETVPDGFFELIIKTVESLGPLAPIAFIAAVSVFECIPLFPTQPLSLASGVLFGTQYGAIYMLCGTTLAATIAFSIARGVGRPLAERIIRSEMQDSHDSDGNPIAPGPVQAKLMAVEDAIEGGTFWQQTGAIFVLRMTPIVPFSASNYVLGLSPLPITPYLLGTASGMAIWSTIYASFGGASRVLLRKGADPDAIMGQLLEKIALVTADTAGYAALVIGLVAVALSSVDYIRKQGKGGVILATDDSVDTAGNGILESSRNLADPIAKE